MINEFWFIHPDKEACEIFSARFAGLPRVKILRQRYEDLPPHDAFVTAGNSFGHMTAGIDAAVIRYFGIELMERVQLWIMDQYLGEQPVGTAFVIATGRPERPFVIHAPTMRVPGSIEGTDKVYTSTWAALLAAHAHNLTNAARIETIVFPAMGTGFGNVSFDEAARQMRVAWQMYLDPPHRLNWDWVVHRHKAISYDDGKQVIK